MPVTRASLSVSLRATCCPDWVSRLTSWKSSSPTLLHDAQPAVRIFCGTAAQLEIKLTKASSTTPLANVRWHQCVIKLTSTGVPLHTALVKRRYVVKCSADLHLEYTFYYSSKESRHAAWMQPPQMNGSYWVCPSKWDERFHGASRPVMPGAACRRGLHQRLGSNGNMRHMLFAGFFGAGMTLGARSVPQQKAAREM